MKLTKFIFPLFMVAGLTLLASCGSNDDGSVIPGEVPSPSLEDKNGNKVTVTKVGDNYFNYDDEGKLKSFGNSNYDEHYEIVDNKFTLNFVDYDEYSNETAEVIINASLNPQGYISAIETKYKGTYQSEYEKLLKWNANIYMKFYYNKNGQLTKIEGNASENGEDGEYEDGQLHPYNYNSSIDNKLDWEDGNLIRVHSEINTNGKEDGEKFNYTCETDYDVSYGDKQNTARQHTYFLSHDLFEDMSGDLLYIDAFAIAGLLGKGSVMLPTAYIYSSKEYDGYDGEGDSWQGNYTLSFTMNSNGTINTEERSNGYYGYGVTYQYGTTTQNNSNETRSIAKEITRRMPKFLKRHINKK